MIDNVLLSNHLFIRKYNVTHFKITSNLPNRENMEMKTYSVTFQVFFRNGQKSTQSWFLPKVLFSKKK